MRRFTLFAATLLTAAIPLLAAWLGRVPESVRKAGVDSCLHLVLPAPIGPIGWPRTRGRGGCTGLPGGASRHRAAGE